MDIVKALEKYDLAREDVESLQRKFALMQQENRMHTEHFFADGMYCRKLWRPAGTLIIGKVHKKEHIFVCTAGEIAVFGMGEPRFLKSGDVIVSQPGTKRLTYAITDAVGMTVHRTDKTDLDEIEQELLEYDGSARFDAANEVVENPIEGKTCLG